MSNSGGSSYPHGSYYTATAPLPNKRPPLQGSTSVDVAIVGAGYTGLTAALHLAKAGKSVAVLEAHRVGWGASGRNGGQIHSGQRQEPEWFEKRFNRAIAQQFFNLGEDAKQLVFSLIEQYKIDCELTPGLKQRIRSAKLLANCVSIVVVFGRMDVP